MPALSAKRAATLTALTWITYILATVQFVRFYMATQPTLDMDQYLAGQSPLPFQKRYLPAILIRGMLRIPPLVHFLLKHHIVLSPPARGCALILGLVGVAVAGYFCVALYRKLSPSRTLGLLVYPLFLVCMLLSYAVHVEQNTNLPYDLPSVAFFTAGLFCIYTRRFLPLFFIVLIGTLNRETALFLIPVYILDAASIALPADATPPLRGRFRLSQVPWLRVLLLCLAWAAVEGALSHRFAGNDRQYVYVRVAENIHRLRPENWPALLNICGYMLPFVLVLQLFIRPARFGNYALVAPLWLAVMVYYGVLTETRIYGELVPYVVLASILLLEQHLQRGPTLHAASVASTTS